LTPPHSPSREEEPQTPKRSPGRTQPSFALHGTESSAWVAELPRISTGGDLLGGDFDEDSDGAVDPSLLMEGASFVSDMSEIQNSVTGNLPPKSPRQRSLLFGDDMEGEISINGINISNITARKQPFGSMHNRSMPAPARKSPRGALKHPSMSARSPASKPHSVSMLALHSGPGICDEEMSFLHRQPMLRTPRRVATNPFQSSPKSTMGSAKKKSRLSVVSARSRYAQDFEERQKIGTGHFSEVYECSHRLDGMTYAVKVLKDELSATRMTKVMSEVFALAALPAHDNVIRYYGCWTENNHLYIQTELCEAGNLESKLREGHRFTEDQLCVLVRQVVSGLSHIHRHGLCHLDIKPENVLVTFVKRGVMKEPQYKIGDLGLVMKSDLQDDFNQDVEGGDGRFMSPELMEGNAEHLRGNLEKSDIWSLGCTVYALARRKDLPSGGDEYAAIRRGQLSLPANEYSSEFVQLLQKMINPDVQSRLTAQQVLREKLIQSEDQRINEQNAQEKENLYARVSAIDKEMAVLQMQLNHARENERRLQEQLNRKQEDSESIGGRLDSLMALLKVQHKE